MNDGIRSFEKPAPPPAEVVMRELHDMRDAPASAVRLLNLAEAHGWAHGPVTYSRAFRQRRDAGGLAYRRTGIVVVRLRRAPVRIWAAWARNEDADGAWGYESGQVWERGVRLDNSGYRALCAEVRSQPP